MPVGGKNSKGIPRCDNYIEIDPDTAPIVRKIFEMYAARQTIVNINEYLNAQQIKTIKKNKFNKNSLRNILQNRRYIGIFTYKNGETLDGEDVISEIPNGIPQIVSEELFYKVQKIMEKNREAPARGKAKVEYILTTKLFCGKCKNTMFGVSSTSKTKAIHNYYACSSQRQKQGCDKKPVRKQWIEDKAIEKCRAILTDENIEIIADAVEAACEKDNNAPNIQRLQKLLKENGNAIENLFKALEAGQLAEQITKRISEKNIERSEIEAQLATEKKDTVTLTKPQVTHFLTLLQQGNPNDIKVRKALIALFVNKIYLYDEDEYKKTKITFILNIGEKSVEITEELLKEIESAAESAYIDSSTPPTIDMSAQIIMVDLLTFAICAGKKLKTIGADFIFRIDIKHLYWINENDNENDFCLHGDISVVIGEETFETDCIVSATSLYLLRTLTENHFLNDHRNDGQMLPCCGHFFIANDTCNSVEISGCPNGIDWTVLHTENEINLITEKGTEITISVDEYKKIVLDFADVVKSNYEESNPKHIPKNDFERRGYVAFWNEWNKRRYAEQLEYICFCPAVSKAIEDGLCYEYQFADKCGPIDTAKKLKNWICNTKTFTNLTDFQGICDLCIKNISV